MTSILTDLMTRLFFRLTFVFTLTTLATYARAQDSTPFVVKRTADFMVNGLGDHAGWNTTDWVALQVQKAAGKSLVTDVKLLYSDTGLYCLFRCEDEKLTTTLTEDFTSLWKEDVVEVFLWPDPAVPIYFEYELSPLNYELPILVPNIRGQFHGWKPWNYDGPSRTQHATSVRGGSKASQAAITGWTAEFFIPYRLLTPIVQSPPAPGSRWRGNLYRIDYDRGYATWAWRKTGGSFHEFDKFGILIFE